MDSSANIDYTKYNSIGPKKIKATTNVIISNYTTAFNAYFKYCLCVSLYNYSEETLEKVDNRLVQIESMLDLLECKLSTIPADGAPAGEIQQQSITFSEPSKAPVQNDGNSSQNVQNNSAPSDLPKLPEAPEAKKDPEEEKNKARAELYKDEQIKTFAKMLKFGVPDDAIKHKMTAMGYDASILDVFF